MKEKKPGRYLKNISEDHALSIFKVVFLHEDWDSRFVRNIGNHTTRRQIPDHSNLYSDRHEKLKFHVVEKLLEYGREMDALKQEEAMRGIRHNRIGLVLVWHFNTWHMYFHLTYISYHMTS
jgi:hypothetical protein